MRQNKLEILITAGPTREYIDPVRYISNDSSGLMGFALANTAKKMGMEVTLIAGPVHLPAPKGIKRIDVVTAKDMHREVFKRYKKADAIIMAAAVADWQPASYSKEKLKRGRMKLFALNLKPNKDILAELGKKRRKDQILVGFALETDNLQKNAVRKLKEKNLDWIVANNAASICSKKSSAILISKSGRKIPIPKKSKDKIAKLILTHVFST